MTGLPRPQPPAPALPSCRIEQGDAAERLRALPDASVSCIVTSPPYYGLRDYGVTGQIGLEATPAEFLGKLVLVFAECLRVLHPSGTLWLNMGDSYAGGGRGAPGSIPNGRGDGLGGTRHAVVQGRLPPPDGLKSKDLMMMPARLAMVLQAEGWWLRSEIVWQKLRPMPESVDDRPTKAHEMIYLLTKSEHYFYDAFAVREKVTGGANPRGLGTTRKDVAAGSRPKANPRFHNAVRELVETRNARDVWTFDANPLRGEEHYAAFPEELARRCILAGSSAAGVCSACGAPVERVTDKTRLLDGEPWVDAPPMKTANGKAGKAESSTAHGVSHARITLAVRHVGWSAGCKCMAPVAAATVLDPFAGSGTTGIAAAGQGRSFVGIELNPKYVAMARRRIAKDGAPLLSRESGPPC